MDNYCAYINAQNESHKSILQYTNQQSYDVIKNEVKSVEKNEKHEVNNSSTSESFSFTTKWETFLRLQLLSYYLIQLKNAFKVGILLRLLSIIYNLILLLL